MSDDIERGPVNRFTDFVVHAEDRARDAFGDAGRSHSVAIGLLMRRVNKLMSVDAENEILRTADLTWVSFRVCFALWVEGPQEPHRVAITASMSRAAVSAARKTLVEKGYVTTVNSETDLRSIVMSLTPEGAAHIEDVYRRHLDLTAEWLSPLSEPEQQIFLGLLGKIMAGPRGTAFGPGRVVNT